MTCFEWLPVNIYDFLWIYMIQKVIWLLVTFCEYIWLSMNIYDFLWTYMTFCEHIWFSVNIYSFLWIYMTCILFSVNIYYFLWTYMFTGSHINYIWLLMNIYDFLWTYISLSVNKCSQKVRENHIYSQEVIWLLKQYIFTGSHIYSQKVTHKKSYKISESHKRHFHHWKIMKKKNWTVLNIHFIWMRCVPILLDGAIILHCMWCTKNYS